jgi:serine/threonine protein kinase
MPQEVPQELGRPDSPPFDWTTNCDIFSLGATLWHLMSLHGPPESVQEAEIQPPLPLQYSRDLRDLITMCCSFNDLERPTAIDVLTACIKRAYWEETFVGPYGLPIAFGFTKNLWGSLQQCRIGTMSNLEPKIAPLPRPSSFLQDLGLLFRAAGEPLSIFVAGKLHKSITSER